MTFLNRLYAELTQELAKGPINITEYRKRRRAHYVLKELVPADYFDKGLSFVVNQLIREGKAEKRRKGREWVLLPREAE